MVIYTLVLGLREFGYGGWLEVLWISVWCKTELNLLEMYHHLHFHAEHKYWLYQFKYWCCFPYFSVITLSVFPQVKIDFRTQKSEVIYKISNLITIAMHFAIYFINCFYWEGYNYVCIQHRHWGKHGIMYIKLFAGKGVYICEAVEKNEVGEEKKVGFFPWCSYLFSVSILKFCSLGKKPHKHIFFNYVNLRHMKK